MIRDSSGREVVRHKVEEALHELMQVKVSIEKNDPRIMEIQKTFNGCTMGKSGFHASWMRN